MNLLYYLKNERKHPLLTASLHPSIPMLITIEPEQRLAACDSQIRLPPLIGLFCVSGLTSRDELCHSPRTEGLEWHLSRRRYLEDQVFTPQ